MIPHEILSTMCLHAASSQPRRRIRWCPWCLAVAALGISRPGCALNRLLLEAHELRHGRAVLPMSDRRARHVAKVLQLRDGEELKVGVLDGGYDDRCRVLWRWPASGGQWLVETPRQMRPERLPMEEIVNVLEQEVLPDALELQLSAELEVDLLLVPPPLERLKRLLPQLVQLGLGTLALCRVPGGDRQVFHCHLLRQPEKLRELLLSGLEQSGFTQVPELQLVELEPFLAKDAWAQKLRARCAGGAMSEADGRVLVAIGPEQGWQPREAPLSGSGRSPQKLWLSGPLSWAAKVECGVAGH
ncbi:unnamed protein product [Cladocopium goreaui]|uniref:16S rRNA (Uracil(1498)-N(3))-methyltransferase n=1 Tax=Cladocopium goreaui TaxID=2562237 RepID=A0A9P1DFD9_9DINO|nr:unnamed protein product [Cladocopium goreaui]